jgi:hypothetical protein
VVPPAVVVEASAQAASLIDPAASGSLPIDMLLSLQQAAADQAGTPATGGDVPAAWTAAQSQAWAAAGVSQTASQESGAAADAPEIVTDDVVADLADELAAPVSSDEASAATAPTADTRSKFGAASSRAAAAGGRQQAATATTAAAAARAEARQVLAASLSAASDGSGTIVETAASTTPQAAASGAASSGLSSAVSGFTTKSLVEGAADAEEAAAGAEDAAAGTSEQADAAAPDSRLARGGQQGSGSSSTIAEGRTCQTPSYSDSKALC